MFAAAPVLNLSTNTKVSAVYFRDLFKIKAGVCASVCACVCVGTGWACEATCPWKRV